MTETKPLYIFLLLGILMFNLFFHVWSSGSFKTLSFEITKTNEKKTELLEQKRLLEAELASLKSPGRIERLGEILEFNPPVASQIELIK
ncbi:MAG: hypothetical protein H6681_03600 [Desulfobacteraceae bacterium]|nr:hypothetical protein [Desulfobacteraceae bacterium]MCB9494514.1 hypothetical protein [Desulfobacteraceae bacterium]